MFFIWFFSWIHPIWAPDSHPKIFSNSVSNSRTYSYSKVKIRESALSNTDPQLWNLTRKYFFGVNQRPICGRFMKKKTRGRQSYATCTVYNRRTNLLRGVQGYCYQLTNSWKCFGDFCKWHAFVRGMQKISSDNTPETVEYPLELLAELLTTSGDRRLSHYHTKGNLFGLSLPTSRSTCFSCHYKRKEARLFRRNVKSHLKLSG